MNPVAESITGWPFEEARGRFLSEILNIVNESSRARAENPAERVRRFGKIVGLANRTILIRRDGREIAIGDNAAPIHKDDSQVSGIVLIFRDIGEKRRIVKESETLLSEVRLRYAELEATYDNAAIAMALIDATEFHYLRVNQKLCEILGQPQDRIVGSKVLDVAAGVPGLLQVLEKFRRENPWSVVSWRANCPLLLGSSGTGRWIMRQYGT